MNVNIKCASFPQGLRFLARTPFRVSAASGAVLLVFQQQRHPGEGLGAGLALVALDVGVRLGVSAQVAAVGEGAVTVRAAERLLARMSAQVSLKQPRPRERLAAQLTPARQRVCPDVHLQRADRRVRLARLRTVAAAGLGRRGSTVRTHELTPGSPVRRRHAVELAVLGQPVRRRVALRAGVAPEVRRRFGSPTGRRRRRRLVAADRVVILRG